MILTGHMHLVMRNPNLRTVALIVIGLTYLVIGAAVFNVIEKERESTDAIQLYQKEDYFREKYNISEEDIRNFSNILLRLEPHKAGIQWDFTGALYFAITVLTTVGYGHSVPRTQSGKIFCMFYSLIGVPLYLVMFQAMGERINNAAKYSMKKIGRKMGMRCTEVPLSTLVPFGLFSCVLTILIGSYAFAYFEEWPILDSVYYCVVTLTTIGFGDYVPLQQNGTLQHHPQYVAFSFVYILVGLTVIGAFLNLVVLRLMVTTAMDQHSKDSNETDEENHSIRREEDSPYVRREIQNQGDNGIRHKKTFQHEWEDIETRRRKGNPEKELHILPYVCYGDIWGAWFVVDEDGVRHKVQKASGKKHGSYPVINDRKWIELPSTSLNKKYSSENNFYELLKSERNGGKNRDAFISTSSDMYSVFSSSNEINCCRYHRQCDTSIESLENNAQEVVQEHDNTKGETTTGKVREENCIVCNRRCPICEHLFDFRPSRDFKSTENCVCDDPQCVFLNNNGFLKDRPRNGGVFEEENSEQSYRSQKKDGEADLFIATNLLSPDSVTMQFHRNDSESFSNANKSFNVKDHCKITTIPASHHSNWNTLGGEERVRNVSTDSGIATRRESIEIDMARTQPTDDRKTPRPCYLSISPTVQGESRPPFLDSVSLGRESISSFVSEISISAENSLFASNSKYSLATTIRGDSLDERNESCLSVHDETLNQGEQLTNDKAITSQRFNNENSPRNICNSKNTSAEVPSIVVTLYSSDGSTHDNQKTNSISVDLDVEINPDRGQFNENTDESSEIKASKSYKKVFTYHGKDLVDSLTPNDECQKFPRCKQIDENLCFYHLHQIQRLQDTIEKGKKIEGDSAIFKDQSNQRTEKQNKKDNQLKDQINYYNNQQGAKESSSIMRNVAMTKICSNGSIITENCGRIISAADKDSKYSRANVPKRSYSLPLYSKKTRGSRRINSLRSLVNYDLEDDSCRPTLRNEATHCDRGNYIGQDNKTETASKISTRILNKQLSPSSIGYRFSKLLGKTSKIPDRTSGTIDAKRKKRKFEIFNHFLVKNKRNGIRKFPMRTASHDRRNTLPSYFDRATRTSSDPTSRDIEINSLKMSSLPKSYSVVGLDLDPFKLQDGKRGHRQCNRNSISVNHNCKGNKVKVTSLTQFSEESSDCNGLCPTVMDMDQNIADTNSDILYNTHNINLVANFENRWRRLPSSPSASESCVPSGTALSILNTTSKNSVC